MDRLTALQERLAVDDSPQQKSTLDSLTDSHRNPYKKPYKNYCVPSISTCSKKDPLVSLASEIPGGRRREHNSLTARCQLSPYDPYIPFELYGNGFVSSVFPPHRLPVMALDSKDLEERVKDQDLDNEEDFKRKCPSLSVQEVQDTSNVFCNELKLTTPNNLVSFGVGHNDERIKEREKERHKISPSSPSHCLLSVDVPSKPVTAVVCRSPLDSFFSDTDRLKKPREVNSHICHLERNLREKKDGSDFLGKVENDCQRTSLQNRQCSNLASVVDVKPTTHNFQEEEKVNSDSLGTEKFKISGTGNFKRGDGLMSSTESLQHREGSQCCESSLGTCLSSPLDLKASYGGGSANFEEFKSQNSESEDTETSFGRQNVFAKEGFQQDTFRYRNVKELREAGNCQLETDELGGDNQHDLINSLLKALGRDLKLEGDGLSSKNAGTCQERTGQQHLENEKMEEKLEMWTKKLSDDGNEFYRLALVHVARASLYYQSYDKGDLKMPDTVQDYLATS